MAEKKKVLFLCTGNSARSILAELLLENLGSHRFEVASAGSDPRGAVHPMALAILEERYGIDATHRARSKSVDELADRPFDLVITVCDHARESCPILPGAKASAHWSLPDPASVGDPGQRRLAFHEVAEALYRRLQLLCSLPDEALEDRDRVEALHHRALRRDRGRQPLERR